MTPAIVTTIWSNSRLASAMASRIQTPEQNVKEGCWMVQRGRWSGTQQTDGYQSVRRCVSEGYSWSWKTGGLNGYHLLRGSPGQLVVRAWGLENERIVSIYLEKCIVRISSSSTERRGIKTSRFSAGIDGNLLTTENDPYEHTSIGKLFYVYSILYTFCTWVKLWSEPAISPCMRPLLGPIARQDKRIHWNDTTSWVYLGVDSSHVTQWMAIS